MSSHIWLLMCDSLDVMRLVLSIIATLAITLASLGSVMIMIDSIKMRPVSAMVRTVLYPVH